MPALKRAKGEFIVKHLGVTYDDFRKEVWVIREFVDGADLEALMKNPSLCPALRSPEKRMTLAVGICKGIELNGPCLFLCTLLITRIYELTNINKHLNFC